MNPTSAYIHVPFCRHRCGYCNFSLVADRDYLVRRYLDAIEWEVRKLRGPIRLETLYLGGGTPSRLSQAAFNRLVQILAARFQWEDASEFTAECNPADLNEGKLAALAEAGVNRISLGVQSMNPSKLQLLERDHHPGNVKEVLENSHKRFDNISLDLIFAAPGETLESWQEDLKTAISLEPQHFSMYELTYEKGTTFWNRLRSGQLVETEEDLKTEMYEWTIETLEAAGYRHYEVASFCRPGKESRHNSVYWSGKDYFAFGPGASSYLNGTRETRHRSPSTYLKRVEAGESPIEESETLSDADRVLEHLVIGLRRRDGIDVELFDRQHQCCVLELRAGHWEQLVAMHLVDVQPDVIRLTRKGLLLYDSVATMLLTPDS